MHQTMTARQLLERLLVGNSRDEILSTIRSWLQANPAPEEAQTVYAVFAEGRLGLDHELLAVYSTRDRAFELVSEQDEQLRACLKIRELKLDRHPTDPYWNSPKGIARAFHILAGLPDDFFPDNPSDSPTEAGTDDIVKARADRA